MYNCFWRKIVNFLKTPYYSNICTLIYLLNYMSWHWDKFSIFLYIKPLIKLCDNIDINFPFFTIISYFFFLHITQLRTLMYTHLKMNIIFSSTKVLHREMFVLWNKSLILSKNMFELLLSLVTYIDSLMKIVTLYINMITPLNRVL